MDEKEDKSTKPEDKPKSKEEPEKVPINPDGKLGDKVPLEEGKRETREL